LKDKDVLSFYRLSPMGQSILIVFPSGLFLNRDTELVPALLSKIIWTHRKACLGRAKRDPDPELFF
jgi:hypothetical protein